MRPYWTKKSVCRWMHHSHRLRAGGLLVSELIIIHAGIYPSPFRIVERTTEFDYITSVYFLFNSVALIGELFCIACQGQAPSLHILYEWWIKANSHYEITFLPEI